MKDLTLRIGGEGGEGVISCGEILTKAAARAHYHIFTYRTYPAEIRGGLAMFQLRVDDEPVLAAGDRLDVLVAFNQEALDNYLTDVRRGGKVLYDPETCETKPSDTRKTAKAIPVPFNEICRKATEGIRGKNIVALGVLANLLGIPLEIAANTVKEKFKRKGDKIVGMNILALFNGYEYAGETLDVKPFSSPPAKGEEHLILSGNQAVGLGALASGVQFCAGYPITPATPIFEFLTTQLPRFGGYIIQMEDEIGAIGACLGASYAGKKVIVPTSGPGMALMTEFISLASMAELPIIIVDVQRSGPSTGMPTKSEQGDLNFAVFGTPGEAPRVVLAPASVEECFELTVIASNIAERYQIPVIVLSDASLAYRTQSVRRFRLKNLDVWSREIWCEDDEENGVDDGESSGNKDDTAEYRRYELTSSGVSPIAVPGTDQAYYQATGLEHDEYGHPNYSPTYHEAMMEKRFHKLEKIKQKLGRKAYKRYTFQEADIGIISWGSTLGTVREALKMAEVEEGIKISHFHPRVLNPLPKKVLREFFNSVKTVIVIEENHLGQLANLIQGQFDDVKVRLINKAQGIPFTTKEVFGEIKRIIRQNKKNQK